MLTAILSLLLSAAVRAEPSAWAPAAHSAARLLDPGEFSRIGPQAADPAAQAASVTPPSRSWRLGGLEIRLDPGFITYWRNPGEAGVPPVFDFAASDNLEQAAVDFPAPGAFDEAGTTAYGYAGHVTFPLRITPRDKSRPVTLDLALSYAVCGKICLPAHLHLSRVMHAAMPDREAEELLGDALARVPQPSRIGAAGALRIDAMTPLGPNQAEVVATTPSGSGRLFVEPPEGWSVTVSPARADAAGHLRFTLDVVERPAIVVPTPPLRLTLVADEGAIEVAAPIDRLVRLDAGKLNP